MSRKGTLEGVASVIAMTLVATLLTVVQLILAPAPVEAQAPGANCAVLLNGCQPLAQNNTLGSALCPFPMSQAACDNKCRMAANCTLTKPDPSLHNVCTTKVGGERVCKMQKEMCRTKPGLLDGIAACEDENVSCKYRTPGDTFWCTKKENGNGIQAIDGTVISDDIPASQWNNGDGTRPNSGADVDREFNTENLQILSNWLMFLALLACFVGICISAALWAVGSKGQNPGQELTGKKGLILCCTAAFFVGALPGMLNWLNEQAHDADTGPGGTGVTGDSAGAIVLGTGPSANPISQRLNGGGGGGNPDCPRAPAKSTPC